MDQPTGHEALKKLEPLLGEWDLEASSPGGEPWPGGGRSTFAWHPSGAHLTQRTTVEVPEAPDSLSVMGCDAANGTYFQLYSDERGVCRVYEMSIDDGEWKLWRQGPHCRARRIKSRYRMYELKQCVLRRRQRTDALPRWLGQEIARRHINE